MLLPLFARSSPKSKPNSPLELLPYERWLLRWEYDERYDELLLCDDDDLCVDDDLRDGDDLCVDDDLRDGDDLWELLALFEGGIIYHSLLYF